MLLMKPQCERCDKPLPKHSEQAFICSYECTFCAECTTGPLQHRCPNCGGNLQPRPSRVETAES
ncbi:DUF1272 domain-containing protein [Marinicella meishanensis]|uniref:DUF1272 domain-containing protein n=1 Tax=Marinicella meishanensis TaxID=2873263 RepID=UPI001CBFC200|nr:DUF1272 domain-containing protein [Marinicella sp. NBU2979]